MKVTRGCDDGDGGDGEAEENPRTTSKHFHTSLSFVLIVLHDITTTFKQYLSYLQLFENEDFLLTIDKTTKIITSGKA